MPNTVQAVSKQRPAEHTSRESTQASQARGRAGQAKTAGHAKRGKKERPSGLGSQDFLSKDKKSLGIVFGPGLGCTHTFPLQLENELVQLV